MAGLVFSIAAAGDVPATSAANTTRTSDLRDTTPLVWPTMTFAQASAVGASITGLRWQATPASSTSSVETTTVLRIDISNSRQSRESYYRKGWNSGDP